MQRLLGEAASGYWHQVDEVILREVDSREDRPRYVHLIPVGTVLGVAITRAENAEEKPPQPRDEDIAFVSMAAIASALPALGLVAVPGAAIALANLGPKPDEPLP
jgi:hypothetical protein